MKNYFGCNECGHCFMKGWHRKTDNKILQTPRTKEQREKMKWWVGSEIMYPLKEKLEQGCLEDWCDNCKAFANSIMPEGL